MSGQQLSLIEKLLQERLTVMKSMPERIRELESKLEIAKLKPAELKAAHELLAAMKKQVFGK
jgi:hypothetical protein